MPTIVGMTLTLLALNRKNSKERLLTSLFSGGEFPPIDRDFPTQKGFSLQFPKTLFLC